MKKIIAIGIAAVLTLTVAGLVWYNTALTAKSRNTTPLEVTIESGMGTSAIADQLKAKGLIGSTLAFKVYLYRHQDLTLKAGSYLVVPGTSTRLLIAQLSGGDTVSNEVNLLIKEGLSLREANEAIKKQGFLTDDSFLRLGQTRIADLPDTLKTFSFLKEVPSSATLEGYLFPDTYRLYKDFTAEDLAQKMLENFDRKVNADMRAAVGRSGRSLHETVIMASILEKEVRTEEDMKIVSGLFWDRLTIGQALQSCATLAYILGVNKAQYTYEDTQIDSPYNTYQHAGLPPGPVSNPGLRSINAAINPTKTDYNYFLSRPDTGETVFSVTLDEHNAAKAKYLK